MDLCHQLWVQRAEQAAMLAALPELPGEMKNALWSDREGRDAAWEGFSDGVTGNSACTNAKCCVWGSPGNCCLLFQGVRWIETE